MEAKDLQSLLREAAVRTAPVVELSENPTENEIIEKAEVITKHNLENKWDHVKEMMEGPFAERLVRAMEAMPDKEFVRVYGKMIEYFKPKVIRVEGTKEKQDDNVLRIEIYNSSKQAIEEDTIDITPEEEDGAE